MGGILRMGSKYARRCTGLATVGAGILLAMIPVSAAYLPNGPETLVLAQAETDAPPDPAPAEAEIPQVTLEAPEKTTIGEEITVAWSGPGTDGDEIQLFAPDQGEDGAVFSFERIGKGNGGSSARLTVPATPGVYHVRYVDRETGDILAAVPVTVELIEVLLEAPETVPAGETFSVTWTGPGAERDRVELFDPAADENGRIIDSQRVVDGNYGARVVELQAPREPGLYNLRYVSVDSDIVLHEMSIAVRASDSAE